MFLGMECEKNRIKTNQFKAPSAQTFSLFFSQIVCTYICNYCLLSESDQRSYDKLLGSATGRFTACLVPTCRSYCLDNSPSHTHLSGVCCYTKLKESKNVDFSLRCQQRGLTRPLPKTAPFWIFHLLCVQSKQ